MKILYIDHHAALPAQGGDCRAVQLAQDWQRRGDEVTMITAGYSHQRSKNRTVHEDLEEQQAEGISLCFLAAPDYARGVGEYRKSIQVFLKKLYVNAPKLAERYRPEIIIAGSGYPYEFFCAQRIAKIARGKTVFELREAWPERQRESYPSEESRLGNCIAEYAMSYALRNADTVVSFFPGGEQYCREKGTMPARLVILPPPAPPMAAPKPLKESDAAALQLLREKYSTLAVYAGPLNARHLPELLVGAVGNLQQQGVAAVIAGNGGYKQLLRRMIRENNWENILLLDALGERQQHALYQAADLIYYGDDRQCQAPYGSYAPFLLRLMQNGKPILTATHGEKNDAKQAGCAIPAGEVTQRGVEEALLQFIGMNGEQRAAMGNRALEALETTHSAEQVAQDYRSALLRLWV